MKLPNVERISRYVGKDQDSGLFYCLGCFVSGFPTADHVNGHQSVCPARHPERQIPTTPPHTPYPVNANFGGGGGGGGTPPYPLPPIQEINTQNTFTLPTPNILLPKTNMGLVFHKVAALEQKIDRIEKTVINESFHEIATRQQIGGIGTFIETYRDFLIGLSIGIFIGWVLNEMLKPKHYSSPVYNRSIDNGRRGKSSSFGSTLANRAAGKAIDYGISRLFK